MFRGIVIVCLFANLFNVGYNFAVKCPHLWSSYGDNCYLLFPEPVTRLDAKNQCEIEGGTLVRFLTRGEEQFALRYWNEICPGEFNMWLGLKRDPVHRQSFVWDNNVAVRYVNWGNNEPNDHGGNEDCVTFEGSDWHDVRCERKFPFMCIKPAS